MALVCFGGKGITMVANPINCCSFCMNTPIAMKFSVKDRGKNKFKHA